MNKSYTEWDPFSILGLHCNCLHAEPYAVIILNTVIKLERNILLPVWNDAAIRITVDGGTNRFYSWQILNDISTNEIRPPEYITGDMDSVDDKVLNHFHGISRIIYTLDQNKTDFTKSLIELDTICKKSRLEIQHVIVVADSSGRLDHIMANINTLFKAQKLYPSRNIYLLANESLSWLLAKGEHIINIPQCLCSKNECCGIIPIGQQCDCITTTGLEWNLDNATMKFGDLVSTSNTFNGEQVVTIKTSHPVLWSMSTYGLQQK